MPIVIVSILIALGIFYVQSDPNREVETTQTEVASTEIETAEADQTTVGAAEPNSAPPPAPLVASPIKSELLPLPGEPTLIASRSADEDFTGWMSPLALDTYIRQMNGNHQQSFWQRGHWISAVEGRWQESEHEFRIVFGKMPTNGKWQWQYRANQTLDAFVRSNDELLRQGYTMVQSQAFERPDGARRYQGVWHKREGDLPAMVDRPREMISEPAAEVSGETSRPTTITEAVQPPPPPGVVGGLDVNRLGLR